MSGRASGPEESTGKAGFCMASEAPYGYTNERLACGADSVIAGTLAAAPLAECCDFPAAVSSSRFSTPLAMCTCAGEAGCRRAKEGEGAA